jgi:predicted DNA-binding WGR domain protein
MQDEVAFALRAELPERNLRRAWRMEAGRDLFGAWVVTLSYGRVATSGRSIVRSFAGEAGARAWLRAGLARRATAPGRLGVAYRDAAGRTAGEVLRAYEVTTACNDVAPAISWHPVPASHP